VFDLLELAGPAQAGALTKLKVVFRNTGQIDSKAVFVGEVQRDGVLVDAIQSVEKLVEPGSSGQLDVFVKTDKPGEYVVTGKINFEGKETDTKTVSFAVADDSSSQSPSDSSSSSNDSAASGDSSAATGAQDATNSGDTANSESDAEAGVPTLVNPADQVQSGGESGGTNGTLVVSLVVVVALAGFGAAGWFVKRRRSLS
jgi:cobalamin biosynthesis Mg chelatase CobN